MVIFGHFADLWRHQMSENLKIGEHWLPLATVTRLPSSRPTISIMEQKARMSIRPLPPPSPRTACWETGPELARANTTAVGVAWKARASRSHPPLLVCHYTYVCHYSYILILKHTRLSPYLTCISWNYTDNIIVSCCYWLCMFCSRAWSTDGINNPTFVENEGNLLS